MCQLPSSSLRLNATSCPSGETAGPQRNGVCVTSTREVPDVKSYKSSVFRQREFTNETAPLAEMLGEASGPDPVVNRIGESPESGRNQRLVAPPRFEVWTMPRPSGV